MVFSAEMRSAAHPSLAAAALGAATLVLLTGCGGNAVRLVGTPDPAPPAGYAGAGFTGVVRSAATPVAGASVMLYRAGTAGSGSAPAALLSSALTTDSVGSFRVPGGYRCGSAGSQLYLVARGGSVSSAGSSNASLALLRALGPCSAIRTGAAVGVGELSTVAGVWALAQFLGPGGALGASATNSTGLANAAATSLRLLGAVTGGAEGESFAANGAAPVAKISALAGLLHLCASDASAAGCASLLSLTTPPGAAAPADTLDAARNLALHPGTHVAELFALLPQTPAFNAGQLAAAPADWTLAATYTRGGLHAPTALAVGRGGELWIANFFGVLSAFDPGGAPVFPGGLTGSGLESSYGLSIDPSDNVWVANESSAVSINGGRGSVTKFSSTGQPLSGSAGFSAGGLDSPVGMAIDPDGTLWVVNYGNASVTLLDGSGQPLSGTSGYPVRGSAFPVAVAIDAAHQGWVGDQNDATVARVSRDGRQITAFACCNGSAALAIDQQGHTWVANFYGASVTEIPGPISGGPSATYSGGGLDRPEGVAIDGAGRIWVANFGSAALTELAGAADAQPGAVLSPAAGWAADGTPQGAFAVAIDGSGNVWATGFNRDALTELIGLAAPVKTPLLGPPQTP